MLMFTPDIFPANELIKLGVFACISSSPLMACMEYPNDRTSFRIPNAVTTTSDNISLSSDRVTLITLFPLTGTTSVFMPTYLNTKLALLRTLAKV
ncbi:hypothetical protein SDC9_149943 [bioreactor metagenome]|uniref:Uncharacterized protein n=1 Tax=bioreactor metagenome TaxID=1076179 RepID=A0A645ELQ9_9ZZZZ